MQPYHIEQWVLDWYQNDPVEMKEKDLPLYNYAKYHFYKLYGSYVKGD